MWNRVSTSRRCTVCGKPDWCGFTDDGLVCCMRVPSDFPSANGGHFHGFRSGARAASDVRRTAADYEPPDFDANLWFETVRYVCTIEKLEPWGEVLGLPADALSWLGGCTLGKMLAFPMYDGTGRICGIRTRFPDGAKRAVTGSRAGVFLPTFHDDGEPVICEGPTDAAAAFSLGFEPIGRPSCAGCERHVMDTCRRFGVRRVTICADADGPGVDGATKLAEVLRRFSIRVRVVTAGGHKDLREWVRAGVSRTVVDATWSQAEWR